MVVFYYNRLTLGSFTHSNQADSEEQTQEHMTSHLSVHKLLLLLLLDEQTLSRLTVIVTLALRTQKHTH